jgi:glucokinase
MEEKYAIGIDIGGTSIKSGLVSSSGKIIDFFDKETPKNFNSFKKYLDYLINKYKNKGKKIIGVGIGIPGMINFKINKIIYLPHVKYLKNKNIQKIILKKHSLNCFIDNDAHVSLSGLLYFKYKNKTKKTIIMLTFGTGTGSAISIKGKLFSGNKSSVAGLGEMIINPKGRICTCGRRGCLNAYTGSIGIRNIIKDYFKKDFSIEEFFSLIEKKDIKAQKALKEISYYFGLGLANIINIFNPDLIVLGGKLSIFWRYAKRMSLFTMLNNQFGIKKQICNIIISPLGQKTGVLGAASLVFNSERKY